MSYLLNNQPNLQQNYLDSMSFGEQVKETKKASQKQNTVAKKEPNYNRYRKFVIKLLCMLEKIIAEERNIEQVKNDEERKKKVAEAYYILNKIKASYNPVKKVNKRTKSSKVPGRSSSSNMYELYCNKVFRTNLLWPFLDRILEQNLKSCQPESGDTLEQEQILTCKEYWNYYLEFRNEERQNGRPVLVAKKQKLKENVEQKTQSSNSCQNEKLEYSNTFINSLLNFMLTANIINEEFYQKINSTQLSQNTPIKNQFEEEINQINEQSQTKIQINQNQETNRVKKLPVFIIQKANIFK